MAAVSSAASVWRSLLAVVVAFESLRHACAYPGRLGTCRAWQAGSPAKASGAATMAVTNLADGSSGKCAISTTGIPAEGFEAGSLHSIEVSSTEASLFKLHSSDGQCLGDETSSRSMAGAKTFTWTAPSTVDSVTFYALCGSGYTSLWAASSVQRSKKAGADSTETVTTATTTTQEAAAASTTTTTATQNAPPNGDTSNAAVGTLADIQLGSTAMTLAFQPSGEDGVELEVRNPGNSWIGVGLNSGSTLSASMVGGGDGSDIVTCSSAGVRRYFVTSYALLAGEEVPEATCTRESGVTILKFTQSLAASGGEGRRLTQVPISPGVAQGLIFARGIDGDFAQKQHSLGATFRGGQSIDFASGSVIVPIKRSGESVLYLHLALMSVAWGAVLPLGAIISKRLRKSIGGAWIHWHRRLQMTGWFLQAVGFFMAALYAEEYSSHFTGSHTFIGLFVVIVGTLQPVNGLLRPHKPAEGEAKIAKRAAWELVHKGLGWLAVVLGVLNVLLGLVLLGLKDYDSVTVGIASAIAVVCLAVPVGAVAYSCSSFQEQA